jgi:hypothetical protein
MSARIRARAARPRLGRLAMLALGLAALAAAPGRAPAALIMTVQSVTVLPGTTGNALDVTLTNTGPSSVQIGGFAFELTTSAGITFTGATTATATAPYIFGGSSAFGPNLATLPPPNGPLLQA